MKRITYGLSMLLFFCFSLAHASTLSAKSAAVINIKGPIGPSVADYVVSALKQANSAGDRLCVMQLDTPGGLSSAMRKIIKAMLASPIPVIAYVTPSGARAASAGTYILYAAQLAVMAPGTNLGAATPVSLLGGGDNDKPKTASVSERKALNDAKAYIRSLAQLHKRNVSWAEQAVSQAASLSASEALAKNVINFTAKDVTALLREANGRTVSVQGQARRIESLGLKLHAIKPSWQLQFLMTITNPSVVYILLMIGFYGLFFEFSNPGYILPGVLGAIALLLSLYALQMLPVNYVGLGLLVLGFAFLVAEAFVSSFGVLAIGGIIALALGGLMLFQPGMGGFAIAHSLIIAVTALTAALVLSLVYVVIRSRNRPQVSGSEQMMGKQAEVVVREGQYWLQYQGEWWQIAEPDSLVQGQKVSIIGLDGLKLIVK